MDTTALMDPCRDPGWDEFVRGHPLGKIYHLSGWRKALESSFRHIRGRCFATTDSRTGGILAGLPIYTVRSRLTGTRLVAAPFATLFDPLVTGPEDLVPLLHKIRELAREERAAYIQISAHSTGPWLAQQGFGESRSFFCHEIDLDRPLDAIRKGFHRSCVRQRIARAAASGLAIRTGRDKSDLKAFYELLAHTRRRRSLPAQPYRFIDALWDAFTPENSLVLFLAEKDGLIIAGLMLLVFKDRVSAELLASNDAFNSVSPVHGLFWHAIQWAHERGSRIFDFGRTSSSNTSLLEFKRHWGASARELPCFYDPPEEAAQKTGIERTWKYRLVQALSSERMPAFISRWVGDFCYRHLG